MRRAPFIKQRLKEVSDKRDEKDEDYGRLGWLEGRQQALYWVTDGRGPSFRQNAEIRERLEEVRQEIHELEGRDDKSDEEWETLDIKHGEFDALKWVLRVEEVELGNEEVEYVSDTENWHFAVA